MGLGFYGWIMHFYLKVEGRGAWVFFFVIFSNFWRGKRAWFFFHVLKKNSWRWEGGGGVGFYFFQFFVTLLLFGSFLLFCLFLKGEGGHEFFFIFFYSWIGKVGVGFIFSLFVIFLILERGKGHEFFVF